MDRDSHSPSPERQHEASEVGNREKLLRLRQEGVETEDASGVHRQRTVEFEDDPHLRSQEVEETEGLHDIEKVVMGRKASKKHKSK